MTDQLDRLKAAVADRNRLERQLGVGGMAIVYTIILDLTSGEISKRPSRQRAAMK